MTMTIEEAAAKLVTTRKLPCCEFCGLALELTFGVDMPSAWMKAVCINDPKRPFSVLPAFDDIVAAAGLRRDMPSMYVLPTTRAPDIPEGRVAILQGWASIPADGHQLFIRNIGDGMGRVVESSEAHGLRIREMKIADRLKRYKAGLGWAILPEGM